MPASAWKLWSNPESRKLPRGSSMCSCRTRFPLAWPVWSRSSWWRIFTMMSSPILDLLPFVYLLSLTSAGCDSLSTFMQGKASLNSEFSFSKIVRLTKAKEPSLLGYLSVTGKKTDRFIPLTKALMRKETKTATFRIWTRVPDFLQC